MAYMQNPAEPTPEQCSAQERVTIPGSDIPAHAVWWPQMLGRHGRAVITVGDCPEVWVWHDGSFPFHDHWDGPGRSPAHLHLSDADQWIDLFEQQKVWTAEWRGDDSEVDEYGPQSQPTADDLVRAGVDPTRYANVKPECPLPVRLADARPDRQDAMDDHGMREEASHSALLTAMQSALRGAVDGLVPLMVTLPDGVTAEQAMEWIRGCERLGLVEPSPAGHMFFPPGVI